MIGLPCFEAAQASRCDRNATIVLVRPWWRTQANTRLYPVYWWPSGKVRAIR